MRTTIDRKPPLINHHVSMGLATVLVATLMGCDNEQNETPGACFGNVDTSANAEPEQRHKAPFEYTLVCKDERSYGNGPQVVTDLETTNEVARNATKDDLRELWQHMAPTLGDRRASLRLKTPVPGVGWWAIIRRTKPFGGEWEVKIEFYPGGIDAEPYHFVNEIDRSAPNQFAMIVTLPMVNLINEKLVRRGWSFKRRSESLFLAESKRGTQSVEVTVTPEGMHVDTFLAEGNTFSDTVELLATELGIASEMKKKLYSVIGSPEYCRAGSGEPAQWSWTFGNVEVTYRHLRLTDNLWARYAQ